jgi:peptidoglycan/LPS O-acetylase OafA/YrhL
MPLRLARSGDNEVHVIRPIQYLRGIAAMMVVWHHALGQIVLSRQLTELPHFGGYGVDMFFVISGFIMLVTTWDKPVGPAEFMRHRIRRIVPLYWLATSLMVIGAIAAPFMFKMLKWDVVALAKSLLFIPYENLSFRGTISPLLVPGWSLNYEMFFYVLFALLLCVGRGWRVPLMVGVLAVLVTAGCIWHPTSAPLQVYTNPVILEFAAGMILGRLWVMKKHTRTGGGFPVLMALGDASYSVYLTHIFTLGAMRVLWSRFVPAGNLTASILWMVFAMTTCAVAGWACYWLVERPINIRLQGSQVRRDAIMTPDLRSPGDLREAYGENPTSSK